MTTKPLDETLSAQLAKTIRAQKKQCWRNAWRAMQAMPHRDNLRYVEGWIISDGDGLLIEHGWLETDTAIIDPTLYRQPPARYFAGLVFTPAEAQRALSELNRVELPIAWQQPDKPAYKAAFDAALLASEYR